MPTHKNCDCHGDASQHASHTIRTMARSASTVVSGRVTNDTAKALASYCSTHDCTQSEALRKALVVLSASGSDPAKALASIAAILGLEPNASLDDIQAAITELSGPDGSDPLSQNPDVAPKALSASDRAIAAKMAPAARAKFVELRTKFTTPIKRVVQSKPRAKK